MSGNGFDIEAVPTWLRLMAEHAEAQRGRLCTWAGRRPVQL
jgi:hypothetical protein